MKIQFLRIFIKYVPFFALVSIILFSCKSLNPALDPGPATPPPVAKAKVNVPLEIPKETTSKLLNSQVPSVLLQQKGINMGNNIIGDMLLKRNGQITWSALDSQRIQVTVPITIVGEVGLKPGGLGSLLQSKLPLDEDFAPTFIIDPVIDKDWSIGSESFELVDLGGSLSVEVLGMQVDLSGLLRKEIQKWGNRNLTVGKPLASLKTLVNLAWSQVGKPFSVDWIGGETAFSIQPQQVMLNEYFDADQQYNLWLGMAGKVNTHPADAAPSRSFPLPGLSPNGDATNEFNMLFPLTISYSMLEELLKENVEGKEFRVDKKTIMIPSNVKTHSFGDFLAINMDFLAKQSNGKTLDGTLFVVGKPGYDAESQSLIFTDVNFKMDSGNFGAQTGVGLKKRKIIRRIESEAAFPIGNVLDESLAGITDRLKLNTPITDLKVTDLKVAPSGFYPMAKELVIHMNAKGTIAVSWK